MGSGDVKDLLFRRVELEEVMIDGHQRILLDNWVPILRFFGNLLVTMLCNQGSEIMPIMGLQGIANIWHDHQVLNAMFRKERQPPIDG